jgi:hypothetical protein
MTDRFTRWTLASALVSALLGIFTVSSFSQAVGEPDQKLLSGFQCPPTLRPVVPDLNPRLSCTAFEYVRYRGERVRILAINHIGGRERELFIDYLDGRFERMNALGELFGPRTVGARYTFFMRAIGGDFFWRNNLGVDRMFDSELLVEDGRPCMITQLRFPYRGTITHCVGGVSTGEVTEETGTLPLREAIELARVALEREAPRSLMTRPFPSVLTGTDSEGVPVRSARPGSYAMYQTDAAGQPYWAMTYRGSENGEQPQYLIRVLSDRSVQITRFPGTHAWTQENVR